MMPADTDVEGVIARMREIDAELPESDGAGVFNRMYLRVTEAVRDHLRADDLFTDAEFMADLDVRFARLWFAAYDSTKNIPKAWEPLFEARSKRVMPIQFALAGMNAHIENDLPLAVCQTCLAHKRSPNSPGVHDDFERVNRLLADVEAEIREEFLKGLDDRVDSEAHAVCAWSIDKARDFAWVNVETLWELRRSRRLFDAYADMIGRSVGMASRMLLLRVP